MGVTVLRGVVARDLSGSGSGSGYGYGYGSGYGSGYGYGYGGGYGSGYEYGYGYGSGYGSGSGSGYGYGYGYGYGDGYGYGYGYRGGDDLAASSPTTVHVTAADIKKAGACSTDAFARAFPGGATWPADRDKAVAAGLNVTWAEKALGLLPPVCELKA